MCLYVEIHHKMNAYSGSKYYILSNLYINNLGVGITIGSGGIFCSFLLLGKNI